MILASSVLNGSGETPVTVQQQIPSNIPVGTGFVISMTINKGDLNGFARLHQTLPAGYTAEPIDAWNARFQQDGQDVKFIWMELPEPASFTVSYRVTPQVPTTEPFRIGGVFSYVKDNHTVRLPIQSSEVNIGSTALSEQLKQSEPTVVRRLIATRPEEGEYLIELTIESPVFSTRARFIDYVPEGYEVTAEDAGDATFTFDKGEATFAWEQLEQGSVSKVSYKVRSGKPQEMAPDIAGVMLYGEEVNREPVAAVSEPKQVTSGWQANSELKAPVEESLTASNSTDLVYIRADKSSSSTPVSIPTTVTNGVYYKVQIAATRNSPPRDNKWINSHFGTDEQVDFFQYDGWNKYQLGMYFTYPDAATAKKSARTFAKGAFVVAFKDGSPVPVQEAIQWQKTNQ